MSTLLKTLASNQESENRSKLFDLFKASPVFEPEKVSQSALFLKRQELSKILFLHDLYSQLVNVHGVIMEFGVRWGQNLVTLINLRGILEPYNMSRKIIGFDTFEGFPSVDLKDGSKEYIKEGAFGVTKAYKPFLDSLLACHENESPLNHINKYELVQGDASKTVPQYLENHPETIIAFAYFDFDIYQPTKNVLDAIAPYLIKGSIIAFDELVDEGFPGETIALREVLGLNNIEIKRNRYSGRQSYFVIQ